MKIKYELTGATEQKFSMNFMQINVIYQNVPISGNVWISIGKKYMIIDKLKLQNGSYCIGELKD